MFSGQSASLLSHAKSALDVQGSRHCGIELTSIIIIVIVVVVVIVVSYSGWTAEPLRDPCRRSQIPIDSGILLGIVEPDVARAARWFSPAGRWLFAFVHHIQGRSQDF